MDFFLQLLLSSTFFGTLCAYLAHKKKKNPYLWFGLGFCFGIFGLLFLFLQSFAQAKQKEPPPPLVVKKPEEKPFLHSLSSYADKVWYYIDEKNQQIGPLSFDLLEKKAKTGLISLSTLVWNEEFPEWKKLQELLKKEPSTNLP
jgi:hypothetical protein